MHFFPQGLPRQKQLRISVSPCHMYSSPAFEKYLSDLCNLCSNDSEEKEGKVGGEKGRNSQKKKEEEKEIKNEGKKEWGKEEERK